MLVSRRRGVSAALALSAALAMVAGATSAHASTQPRIKVEQGVTQPVFSYADAIREYVYVESSVDSDGDGANDRVRVDIIRPKESDQGLKVPAIIDESPYYDNSGRGNEAERKTYDADGNPLKFPLFYDNYFVPRGYAVLNVDMIGTTRSDGCPDMGGKADVLGGKAVIDWLNGRAKAYDADGDPVKAGWSTGKAGMIGKSYDGTLANAVAGTGVEGLATIVPINAISSWYRYQRMNGLVYNFNYPSYLTNVVDTDPDAKCAAVRTALDAAAGDDTGNYNAFWQERDYLHGTISDVRKVRASVFAVHTLNDLNVKTDNLSTWWDALGDRNVPRKIWLGQYEHVDPFDYRRDVWVDTLHRWFDYWLQGVKNGIMHEPRADIQAGPDTWITQKDWPAPHTDKVALRPAADGTLGLAKADKGTTATFTDLRQSENAMTADVGTPAAGRAAFTTGELPADLRMSGTPEVSLKVTLDKPTSNLTALLVDFGEEARVDWRSGGGITTNTDETCYGESTEADDACYRTTTTRVATRPLEIVARGWIDVQNRDSLTTSSPLPAGESGTVTWDTLPQDYTFKQGHRLGVILAGTDSSYVRDAATGAAVTVDLSKSRITLPLVSDRPGGPGFGGKHGWHGPARVDLPTPQARLF
ncbi:Xaa-Pro dipeptidyl-peptidase [Planotetraspora phitsanulokensis]|uniref:Xaa-Pro dipeptidyl-peptidase n=2 Tax=Planotetraspora phitsanulokensis TaxID=575192 RepID=A0A8J3U4P4_9ACTN|nr:Xaa-Pro dipeptidyl-peptidase [Planotetraspora phitsanulokensis]GII36957.1 X-Pro dipeptidyl-peptidase [Planotetraspora phitsanulokensis]